MFAGRGFALGLTRAVVTALLALATPSASAQHDWSIHLGPRPTGFERVRFGSWDLEILSLRGMVDRAYYEDEGLHGLLLRSFTETTRGAGAGGNERGPVFRRSRTTMDREGRIKRIEYEDPLTRKLIQRETFAYDAQGRLVEWSRSRPPSEVAIASITRTQYPGAPPYGMAQTFSYDEDGTLVEWRACTIVTDQRLQDCKEDYVKMNGEGRIVEFGGSGEITSIERDARGNATAITVRGQGGSAQRQIGVSLEDDVLVEREGETVVGRTFFDDRGNLIQYQVTSADSPGYYTTVTWSYDAAGRVVDIVKAFDSYHFGRDAAGRIVEVDQTVIPRSVRRSYDGDGRLAEQEPPLFFRRMSPTAIGSERYRYDADGLLQQVVVRDSSGSAASTTSFEYARRRLSRRSAPRERG